MLATLVGGRKDSDQLPIRKLLYPVHHTLVRAYDLVDVVVLAERVDAVRPKFNDVPTLVGVTDVVGQNALFFVIVSGVTPQNIHHQQVFLELHLVDDFEWTLQLLDVCHFIEGCAYAAVQTQDPVVDQRSHRQLLEHAVERIEDGKLLIDGVLSQPGATLVRKPEIVVYKLVFVITTQQMDTFRLLAFEC